MKRIFATILLGLLCLQLGVFAQEASLTGNMDSQVSSSSIQPRGTYLWKGSSAINPGSGYVTVSGNTKCYSNVSEVKITLIVLQEISPSIWQEVWRNSYSEYGAKEVYSPYVNVPVGAGKYKVIGEHYAINGYTEYNSSETNPVTVY